MKNVFVSLLIFAAMALGYAVVEANSASSSINFQSLDGGTASPCDGRVDGDLSDYHDIELSDGFRWQYVIDVKGGQLFANLIVEFVCEEDNGEIGVLALVDAPWRCSDVGNGVTIGSDVVQYDGGGGLSCSGPSVEQAVKAAVDGLGGGLPEQFAVTDLFAEAFVRPFESKGVCSREQVLFANKNVSYALPLDEQDEMRLLFVNRPNSAERYANQSNPIQINKPTHVKSFVEHQFGVRGFLHSVDGMVITANTIDEKVQFTMLPNLTAFTLGVASDGYFCGTIGRMVIDPYAGIGSD